MVKKILPGLGIIALLVVSGGLLFYMQSSPRFEIARVGIRGHSHLTPEMIVNRLNLQPHTNIFQVRLDLLEKQLEALTWIKRAQVYRNFPNKLSIAITERTPFALVKLDELHLVDREGVVLGALTSGDALHLPILTGSLVEQIAMDRTNPQLGEALHEIAALLNSSTPWLTNIRKIEIECLENVTFFPHDQSPEIRMSLRNYQDNLPRLEQIASDLPEENIASIDLRFDRRIVVTPKKI
ncbi:FtsQ-type POTRA domain-containing protein [candidate division KSB3 bacterium]|uniref:FtsQ-type POTRA domain-containing protein n=1 Tax=candidate division KSB3 bacterium TaxID=2044937 RepID=A0A9D5K0A9_9BACT|nr:FtsQ-type POTRA domain-containing protein [candidate division KSB3 bacterium]MBD3327602.1 FtsQ-type POTRA domain-containing protein [candidate division KSB3 bacterium]